MEGIRKRKITVVPDVDIKARNEALIKEYLMDAQYMEFTERTIETYRSCLHVFYKLIDKLVLDVDIPDLKSFKMYLKGIKNRYNEPLSKSTVNRYFSALHSFYEYLEFENYIDKSPLPKFRKRYLREYKKNQYSNGGSSRRKLISIEEMVLLVNSILDPRDKAVVMVLAKTGIRRGELSRIDVVDDIDWLEQRISLKPTAKRSNLEVFFDDECARVMKRWMISRENRKNKGTKALFLNERGGRLGRNAIYELVVKYATRVGLHDPSSHRIQDRFGPHCCRHWFTTHLRRAHMPREFIKELRGDSLNETIDIYDHIDPDALKDAYLSCIPQLGID